MDKKAEISYDAKNRWRRVPLWSTVLAANACNRGVDYQGCSKSDIYLSFERQTSYGNGPPDIRKFTTIMDGLYKIHVRREAELRAEVDKFILAQKHEPADP